MKQKHLNHLTGVIVNNNIDYEDIYDNIDDYEYPYNYINRGDNYYE